MAVHIRLARHGSKHRPFYHLIAADHKMRRDGGRFIEKLGVYDPAHEPSLVEFKEERVRFWYERGAQLSDTVAKLLKAKNIKVERKKTATK
jgi:small subunit ribosomal protein S16